MFLTWFHIRSPVSWYIVLGLFLVAFAEDAVTTTTKAPTTKAPTTKASTTTQTTTTEAPTTKTTTTTKAPTTETPKTTKTTTTTTTTKKVPATKAPTTEAPKTTKPTTTKATVTKVSPTEASKTTTTTTTTTKPTTTKAPTTKAPTTEAPTTKAPTTTVKPPTGGELKTMIIKGAGNRINSAYNYAGIHHIYRFGNFNWGDTVRGYRSEGLFGYVVNQKTYAKIKEHCPELVKATLAQKKSYPPLSKFSTGAPPRGYAVKQTFYCAPRKGYCGGANLEMVEIRSKVGTGDNFYPRSSGEQHGVLKNNMFYRNEISQRVCWIWRFK